MTRVVVALGGNALLRRGESPSSDPPRRHLDEATELIARIAARHDVVLVHGNGPQVGLLAMRAEAGPEEWREPLDIVNAESDGMIGYMLQRELRSRLPERSVVTLLTQVVVAEDDPAFSEPSKPIGPTYTRARAEQLAAERGWRIGPDGDGWRRLVASPFPRRVLELDAIRALVDSGHLVVCGGGGGLPVFMDPAGRLTGVEAVVDKDHSATLIAIGLPTEALLLLTDANAVYRNWPERRDPIVEITASEIESLELPAGSMRPKALAAAHFARATGNPAVIGAMEEVEAMLAGEAGTRVVPD